MNANLLNSKAKVLTQSHYIRFCIKVKRPHASSFKFVRILHSSFLSAGEHDSCKASLFLHDSFLEWSCQHVPLPSTFKWSQAASFNFSFCRKCSCVWILGSRRSGKLIRCFVPMASQFQHEMRIVSLINDAQIVERAAVVVTKSRFN